MFGSSQWIPFNINPQKIWNSGAYRSPIFFVGLNKAPIIFLGPKWHPILLFNFDGWITKSKIKILVQNALIWWVSITTLFLYHFIPAGYTYPPFYFLYPSYCPCKTMPHLFFFSPQKKTLFIHRYLTLALYVHTYCIAVESTLVPIYYFVYSPVFV